MRKLAAAVALTATAYASLIGGLSCEINKPYHSVVLVSQHDSRESVNFGIYDNFCDGKYDGVRRLDADTLMDHPFFVPLGADKAFTEAIEAIEQLNLGMKYNVFFQTCRVPSNPALRKV